MTFRINALISGAVLGAFCAGAAFYRGASQAGPQQTQRTGEQRAVFNENAYGYHGEVSGRVLLDNGKPALGFTVRAQFVTHHSLAPGEGEAITDSNGEYRLHGLTPEPFRVAVETRGAGYVADAVRVANPASAPDNKVAGVNFTLHLGPQITVRVQDAETSKPIPGLVVEASSEIGSDHKPVGETDVNGEFRYRGDALVFQLEVKADKPSQRGISAAPGFAFYHRINQTDATQIVNEVWSVKTYNSDDNNRPTTFRGIVTHADGTPAARAKLHLIRPYKELETYAKSDGRFSFTTTRIAPFEGPALIQAQSGNEKANVFIFAEQSWGQIKVPLKTPTPVSVSGQVVGPDGKPLGGVPLSYDETFSLASPSVTSSLVSNNGTYRSRRYPGGVTDRDGNFIASGLSDEAAYRFTFGQDALAGRKVDWGRTDFPPSINGKPFSSKPIRLKRGENKIGPIVVLPATDVVGGRITNADGTPAKNVSVSVEGNHTHETASPNADGTFRATNIVREPLRVGIYQINDGFSRTSPGSSDDLYQGTVRAGDTNVKIILPVKKQP